MPLFASAHLNFGYPWWLSYAHLPIVAISLLLVLLGYALKWSKGLMLVLGVLLLWSSAAFVVMRFVIDINGPASLPTQSFLPSGTGKVLDLGAGTGRSSIMVLEARPQTRLVALDLFGDSFNQHFGPGDGPQERLLANLRTAGVAQRASITTADMRKLPFEPGTFDGIVSAYAVDHLNSDGIHQALAEAARVVKPGGEFLLILIAREPWIEFAFGPLIMHAGLRGTEWWKSSMQEAGFQVIEEGTRPATLYLLAKRPI